MWRKYILVLAVLGLFVVGMSQASAGGEESVSQEPPMLLAANPTLKPKRLKLEPALEPVTEPAIKLEPTTETEMVPRMLVDDDDGDGVVNDADNCLRMANPDQQDTNNDGEGDRCDTDDDGDHVLDISDNCLLVRNRNQDDSDRDGIGDACDKWPDVGNAFAVERWEESISIESKTFSRSIVFEYSDEGEINKVQWDTSGPSPSYPTGEVSYHCELISPCYKHPPDDLYTYYPHFLPTCRGEFTSGGGNTIRLEIRVDEAQYIVDSNDDYKGMTFKCSLRNEYAGMNIEASTDITRQSGRITKRVLDLTYPSPEGPFVFENNYAYNTDGNIISWTSFDLSTAGVQPLIERRVYTQTGGLLQGEEIEDINLLAPITIDLPAPKFDFNVNCCKTVADVGLGFSLVDRDPNTLKIMEMEKLYEKDSTNLRYEVRRTIVYKQVKNPPPPPLFEAFVDMAQPILLLFPRFTPVPPFDLR